MPQTKKIYYYVNWGSGYVEVDAYNIKLVRSIERGEFNDYAFRLKLEGSFRLIDDDADDAFTYFITNGNYKVPMKLYENGDSGAGVLKWEGWARAKATYDITAELATFNSFETNDQYTALIPFLDTKIYGEAVHTPDVDIRAFEQIIQGLNANSNKLQAYTYSSPNWSATGNALSLPYVGRVVADQVGTGLAVYDNITRDLRRYIYSAPNWSLSSLGTSLLIANGGNGALAAYTASSLVFVDDYNNELRTYTQAAGTWALGTSRIIESLKYPSLALLNSASGRVALVDAGTKMLRAYTTALFPIGTPLSIGDAKKPCITALDGSNDRVALVDAESQTLRCMEYTSGAGTWAQVGDSINVGGILEPALTQDTTNSVILHDSFLGTMQTYAFSGTVWSKTGNSLAVAGGLYSGIGGQSSSILGIIQSDNYKLRCRPARAYITLLNGLLSANGIYSGTDYVFNSATNGATFDEDKTMIGNLQTLYEVFSDITPVTDLHQYTLRDTLKLAELFQNYWYIEYAPVVLGDYQIKFKQPDNFSSVGGTVDVTAYEDVLHQRTYEENINLDIEELDFNNARNADFEGAPVLYGRNTNNKLTKQIKYTTDWGYLVDNRMGTQFNFQNSGVFLSFGEDKSVGTFSGFVVEAGTGILGGSNVKNQKLSKARIQDDYWKDYRYILSGNFTLNGGSVSAQDTVRKLEKFPDVKIKLSAMPDAIGNLSWNTRTSWVTAARTDLTTYLTTYESRTLDI